MADRIVQIAPDFWNIRGTYRLLGLLNVGTQTSLVRCASGRFVLLDCYTLKGDIAEHVMELTQDGAAIDAIINLHPFHTMHVEAVAQRLPHARLYGTARHHTMFPSLNWQPERTESTECAAIFADDFDFMVPDGVAFIPDNERLHFASVLAFHRMSATLHIDDTLNWIPWPLGQKLAFHPTLKKVLEPRAGAAQAFRAWAHGLIERCGSVRRVCTAHAKLGDLTDAAPGTIAQQVREALDAVNDTLLNHEKRHG